MTAVKKRFKAEVESLRARGVRMTPQRLAVVEYLFSTRGHPSAADVHSALLETLPTLSLSTVYDTLEMLRRQGTLDVVCPFCDRRLYLVADDSHLHTACVNCQRVDDFPSDRPFLSDAELSSISRSIGYIIHRAKTLLFGLCPNCR